MILGTLAVYVYPTMAILAYGTSYLAVMWRRSLPAEAWPPVLAVTVVTALMTPLEYHLASLSILAASLLIEFVLRRLPRAHRPGLQATVQRTLSGRTFLFLSASALLAGFVDTLDSPWAAAEVFVVRQPVTVATQDPASGSDGPVHLTSSTRPFVGYVVDESLTGYTVLNAATRYLMLLDQSQVVARYTCHSKAEQVQGRQPLLNRLLGRPYASPNADCDQLVTALQQQLPGQGA